MHGLEKETSVFRECDIRGIVERDFPSSFVYDLGRAFATLVQAEGGKCVVVGMDVRLSSNDLFRWLTEGILAAGCDCIDVGKVPTPVFYYSQHFLNVSGGIMITGSHNPPEYNGFKPVINKENLWGAKLRELESIIRERAFFSGNGKMLAMSLFLSYRQFIANSFGKLKKMKVVVDCGNGCGGYLAPMIFEDAGLDVVPLFCEPDGNFPNHHPDPSREENLTDLRAKVMATNANIGIAFDGDADRLGIVDETGEIVTGEELLILFARAVLGKKPGGTVVFDVKCSNIVKREIRNAGGRVVLSPTGHALVKESMRRENACLGGELSGHFFFREGHFGFDDPFYAALYLCDYLGRNNLSLHDFKRKLPVLFSTPELRIPCPKELGMEVVGMVGEHFRNDFSLNELDGVRIEFRHGWGLVRVSNTEPMITLRFEAESREKLEEYKNLVLNLLPTDILSENHISQ